MDILSYVYITVFVVHEMLSFDISYSGNLLREEIFANHMILFSEEILAIFDYCDHNR